MQILGFSHSPPLRKFRPRNFTFICLRRVRNCWVIQHISFCRYARSFPPFVRLFWSGSIRLRSITFTGLSPRTVSHLMIAASANQTFPSFLPTITFNVIGFSAVATRQMRSHLLVFLENFSMSYLASFCRPLIYRPYCPWRVG